MPGRVFGQMGDAQFDAQLTFAQMESLTGAIGKGLGAIELQHHFVSGCGNHLPALLPGAAVNR
ncbi:hypothetical protein D3C84_1052260 [compost metagenome]